MDNDKNTVSHLDAIENAPPPENGIQTSSPTNANEEIIQHLQTTGEEVGMTWRTTMAAIVGSQHKSS